MKKENDETNILELAGLMIKYWLPIAVFTLIIAAVTYVVTVNSIEPEYRTSATLLIGAGPDSGAGLTITDVQVGRQLLADYKELAASDIVLEQVITDLQMEPGTGPLRDGMAVESAGESRFFRISYTGKDPSETALICNTIADALVQKAAEVMGSSDVRIIYRARVPEYPSGPNVVLYTMAAAFCAFILACFFALIKIVTDDSYYKPADIVKDTGIKIVGVIPSPARRHRISGRGDKAAPIKQFPAAAESYKMLKAKLNYEFPDKEQNVIMFTSASSEDGKTVNIVNTALAYERAGKKVLLMGCDLNNHMLYEMLNLNQSPGLSNHLLDGYTFTETLQTVETAKNLHFLAYGRIFYEQTDIFSLEIFTNMLARIRAQYDFIFIDAPPLLRMSDAAIISRMVDIIILVVELNVTKRDNITRAKGMLQNLDVSISGALINRPGKKAEYGVYRKSRPLPEL